MSEPRTHTVPVGNTEAARLLRDLRNRSGLTQEDLAERAGVSVASIRHYENKRRKPDFTLFRCLIEAMGYAPMLMVVDLPSKHTVPYSLPTLREELQAARKAEGMSRKRLANELGYDSEASIRHIETGRNRVTPEVATEWMRVVGVKGWRLVIERDEE
jgi:transcriptional regulator with XRE-family HTH domain